MSTRFKKKAIRQYRSEMKKRLLIGLILINVLLAMWGMIKQPGNDTYVTIGNEPEHENISAEMVNGGAYPWE